MAVPEGLPIVFMGEPRHAGIKGRPMTRKLVPQGSRGVVIEDTGRGVLCDFEVKGHTLRMYTAKHELRKIKEKKNAS